MSGADSVVGKCGKLKFYALLKMKPMKIFKYARRVCVLWESMTETMYFSCDSTFEHASCIIKLCLF